MLAELAKAAGAVEGDLLLMVADKPSVVANALGHLRLEMAKRLNLIDENKLCFLWVVDFPMFEYDEEEKRWTHDTTDELLSEMLARLTQEQAGVELDFDEI